MVFYKRKNKNGLCFTEALGASGARGAENWPEDLARKAEEGIYFQVEVRNSFVLQLVLLVSVRHHCNLTFKYSVEPKQMSCLEKEREANDN